MITSIRPHAYTANAPSMLGNAKPAEEAPAPVDTLPGKSTPKEEGDSRLYRIFRGAVGGGAAVTGGLAGVTVGSIKGAFGGTFVLGETAHRILRGASAVAGLAAGACLGASFGPLGIVAGVLAGPALGAVGASALIGAVEGGGAALMGAVQGAKTGAQRAYKAATQALDTLVHGRKETPAESSAPSAPPSPTAAP